MRRDVLDKMKEVNEILKCPYCGYEEDEPWDHHMRYQEEITVECAECDREYDVTVHYYTSYEIHRRDDYEYE